MMVRSYSNTEIERDTKNAYALPRINLLIYKKPFVRAFGLINDEVCSTGQARTALNRFDPKYASFGPRAQRLRPAAPAPPLATFTPVPHNLRENPRENLRENPRENSRENSRENPRENLRENPRENPREHLRENARENTMRDRELPPPRENPRDLPPMRERELPREPMRERELPREPREREGDKYATVRAPRRTEPQPLSAAALEYRSLQRPRRGGAGGGPGAHRRRPERAERHDHRDLYAVTEL